MAQCYALIRRGTHHEFLGNRYGSIVMEVLVGLALLLGVWLAWRFFVARRAAPCWVAAVVTGCLAVVPFAINASRPG